MMVETSAIRADLPEEAEWQVLADLIEAADEPITTPIAMFEATIVIATRQRQDPAAALAVIEAFLREADIAVSPFVLEITPIAVDASTRYGKGLHAADLNFGDRLSYAAVRHHDARLLFKAADFAATDVNAR